MAIAQRLLRKAAARSRKRNTSAALPDDLAGKVLVAHGVTLEAARRRSSKICGDGLKDPAVRWTHTSIDRVRKLADVEAERLAHPGQLEPRPAHTSS